MSIVQKDNEFIWHPYTQMGLKPSIIPVVKGKGVYLYDENDNAYLDAISSWWVNLHGHAHPYIAQKVYDQLKTLEHVIFAGFTHQPAVELAERLIKILPDNQRKVFYSDNGSTAVEVAIKMAIQFFDNQNKSRTKIIAFENAYHGDTFGAMSISGRGIFTKPFQDKLFDVVFLPAPTPGKEKESVAAFSDFIDLHGAETAAFIFEPLVQGTAGMVMYEPEFLDDILRKCHEKQIVTIADEVMTGFGRTGKLFASNYLTFEPDIFCLSKGITGGTMAMGLTTCSQTIFDAFYSSDKLKTLFHGHSYTANPVACSAALASLDLLQQQETQQNISRIEQQHLAKLDVFKNKKGVKNCRVKGTIFAVEIEVGDDSTYLSGIRDQLYDFFIQQKIILRPLGNIVYIMPPYCTQDDELQRIYNVIEEAIDKFSV